jgi:GNAT superfamily N-acetyltransferase
LSTNFEIIVPSSEQELEGYYRLRWRLLREPWGQPRGSERDELEAGAWHVAARSTEGATIGVGRLHRIDADTGQIRYMAVEPEWQGKGVGAAILAALETVAIDNGMRRIELDARAGAVAFYEHRGYVVTGPAHILFGTIPHQRMARSLVTVATR